MTKIKRRQHKMAEPTSIDPAVQSIYEGLKAARPRPRRAGVSWSALGYSDSPPRTDAELLAQAQEIVAGQRGFPATCAGRFHRAMGDIGTYADQLGGQSIRGDAARSRGWVGNVDACLGVVREMRATMLMLHELIDAAETAALEQQVAQAPPPPPPPVRELHPTMVAVFDPFLRRAQRGTSKTDGGSMNGVA